MLKINKNITLIQNSLDKISLQIVNELLII